MMTEDDVLSLPSLLEAWRPPAGGKRTMRGASLRLSAGQGRGGQADSARAKLARIVRKAPEVMVKVSGRQRGGGHVSAHLEYIGRHGKLEVETGDGERISSVAGLRALAAEWEALDDATNRGKPRPTSISMVLSMPAGIPADIVRDAARAFARVELGERFSYAMALHTDTDHPHVHVTVAAEGQGGLRFNPRKADLHAFRESFAHELRARGVECEATPRRARGVVRKPDLSAVRHIDLRAERRPRGRGGESVRQRRRTLDEASRIARSSRPDYRPQDDQALRRQQTIRSAYQDAVKALEGTGKPEDRMLAEEVRAFVADMPAPLSRRLALAVELGQRDRRAVGEGSAERQRGPDSAARSADRREPPDGKGPARSR